ncbi:hypothetical protein LZ31DRAFT_123575 [Colletotrichum somersetense]|nr:hypothetical protein LZ31DRAFT_123575 [Colletotrichum somersetense]
MRAKKGGEKGLRARHRTTSPMGLQPPLALFVPVKSRWNGMANRPFLRRRVCRVVDRRWISLDSLRDKTRPGQAISPLRARPVWRPCTHPRTGENVSERSLTGDRWGVGSSLCFRLLYKVPLPRFFSFSLGLAVPMVWLEIYRAASARRGEGRKQTDSAFAPAPSWLAFNGRVGFSLAAFSPSPRTTEDRKRVVSRLRRRNVEEKRKRRGSEGGRSEAGVVPDSLPS